MAKFCVISYDHDEQQTFTDFVEAATPDAAKQIVSDGRDYILAAVDVLTAQELREIAERLDAAKDLPDSAWALAKVNDEDENFCTECGEPNDDGEGFDGLCGPCADRKEAAEEVSNG